MKFWTWHIYKQPHGYPGDYELLDHLYHCAELPWHERIDVNPEWPAVKAIRERSFYMRKFYDSVQSLGSCKYVLDLACGSGTISANALVYVACGAPDTIKYFAVDGDANAIQKVKEKWCRMPAMSRAVVGNVATQGPKELQLPLHYDFIWMCGIGDYFQDGLLTRVIRRYCRHLQVGGKMVIGNFDEDNPQRFLMKLVGWSLIYRNEDTMKWVAQVALTKITDMSFTFKVHKHGVQLYLEITRTK